MNWLCFLANNLLLSFLNFNNIHSNYIELNFLTIDSSRNVSKLLNHCFLIKSNNIFLIIKIEIYITAIKKIIFI